MMMYLLWLLTISFVVAERERPYIGYKSVHIKANSRESMRRILRDLPNVDPVSENHLDNSIVAIVTRDGMDAVHHVTTEENANVNILWDNLQEFVDTQYLKFDTQRRKRSTPSLQEYVSRFLTLDEMDSFHDDVKRTCNSQADVEINSIGSSAENRPIKLIKIKGKDSPAKYTIFIEAGIHAREWLSPAFANYVIYQLACNTTNTDLLEMFNWEIIAVLNPDGYHHTHSGVRFWRKNRQFNEGSACIGTDLNRNFETGFGGSDTSNNTCSETYPGSYQYSAPETQVLRDYVLRTAGHIFSYLSIHTFGQYILLPWGYKYGGTEDRDLLETLARRAERAMGVEFKIGPAYTTIYPASGISTDFTREVAGIDKSYTWELMPREAEDAEGFAPDEDSIPRYTQLTWRGLRAYVKALRQ